MKDAYFFALIYTKCASEVLSIMWYAESEITDCLNYFFFFYKPTKNVDNAAYFKMMSFETSFGGISLVTPSD